MLRLPLAALWQAPSCAPDVAAWRPLLATLEHQRGRQQGPEELAASALTGPADLRAGSISLQEAASRLRLNLAEAAAARSDTQLALRLLVGEPAASSTPAEFSEAAAASPSQLLAGLRAAAQRAQLPATGSSSAAAAASAAESLTGSGWAPAEAAQLCQLLDSIVRPLGGSGKDASVPGTAASSLGLAAGSAGSLPQAGMALQPEFAGMPASVRAAAARGCLLLARWAEVRNLT